MLDNIGLMKLNLKELSAIVNCDLTQPDDVHKATLELVQSDKTHRVVVSL